MKRIVSYGITALQVILLSLLVALEYLSGYRAGLAQHLYFKKISYLNHFYHGMPLFIQVAFLVVLTSLVIILHQGRGKRFIFRTYKYFGFLLLLLLVAFLPFTENLNIYAHALMVLECCIVLEAALLFYNRTHPSKS